LIGVSDGFHIDDEDWDVKLRFYNLITQTELKYKRQRVRRGMRGVAGENRTLGIPPLGYTRRVKREANGYIERRPNGTPKTELCIDPETLPYAQLMWELFYVKKWSKYQIAKQFNDERVCDWDGWTPTGIEGTLLNPLYCGYHIWNRTRSEFNWETQRWERVSNHWKEWEWC
jgi:hypothetical protein